MGKKKGSWVDCCRRRCNLSDNDNLRQWLMNNTHIWGNGQTDFQNENERLTQNDFW